MVVREDDQASVCLCGSGLVHTVLPAGVYEIVSPAAAEVGLARDDERDSTEDIQPVVKEVDQGYGASHGYGPAHGGPTGPGDAPSD